MPKFISKNAYVGHSGFSCLGYLGQCDTSRNGSICVVTLKVVKVSATTVTAVCKQHTNLLKTLLMKMQLKDYQYCYKIFIRGRGVRV